MSTTNPLAAGNTTSEAKGSKVVVILAAVIGSLGTILEILDKVTVIVPASTKGLGLWLALGGVAIAGLTQIAYTIQRGIIKVEAIRAGTVPPADSSGHTTDVAAAAANLGQK